MINTLDSQFFEVNIPEAFSARKLAHWEKQNKMVEVLPFFYNVITTSNMIANGKFPWLTHSPLDNKRGKVFSGFNKVSAGSGQGQPKKERSKPQRFEWGVELDHRPLTLGQRSTKAMRGEGG